MIITGKTQKGRGIGRKIGFPTLNIPYNGKLRGVFAAKVFLNGKWYCAAVHIGSKPTFDDADLVCEAYLIEWNGDVAPKVSLKINILKRIRDSKKFDTIGELKQQISRDVEFVKNCYNRFI